MNFALDVRPALARPTGVGAYTLALARRLPALAPGDRFYFFSASLKDRFPAEPWPANATLVDRPIPVRALNYAWNRLGGPALDRFVPTDLAAVVREVLEAYRFPIEQQGFTLEVQIAEDLPEVAVDPEAISQALLNLVNNAIKYSPNEKFLRLEVRKEDERVLVSVTDRGIGVPRGDVKRIFEKFFRAENSLVHETKGSGLGLALVQHIMEAHGGSVEVVSSPGRGSTFTLALPLRGRTETT